MIGMDIKYMNRYGYNENYNTRKRLNKKIKKAKRVLLTIDTIKNIINLVYIILAIIKSDYIEYYIYDNSYASPNQFIFGSAILILLQSIVTSIFMYEFYKTIKKYML